MIAQREARLQSRRAVTASRYYSAAAEPAKSDEASGQPDAKAEPEKEDPVKKELEAKRKEVIDVTVGHPSAVKSARL